MIVPASYVGHFSGVIANTRINPNLPTQAFIADFLESGLFDQFLKYLCQLYRPRMEVFNASLQNLFPGAFPAMICGGFFAPLTLGQIPKDKEVSFTESAKQAGVGIASAWDAVPPDCREETRKKGLFIRLTFPAFKPENIQWGLAKLKETLDRFA
jgi:DNA-binding transcriptional MocR family regulator